MNTPKKTTLTEEIATANIVGFGWGVLLGMILNALVALVLGLAFLATLIMVVFDIHLG